MEPIDLELHLTDQLLAVLSIEQMEKLARQHFTAEALRRRRLGDRDRLIRRLAIGRPGSGHDMAGEIRRDLRRAATTWFRFAGDRIPDDPRRQQLHRVLSLNRGKIPSERALRRILAGLGGPNSPAAMAQDPEYPLSREKPRGRDEGLEAREQRPRRRRGRVGASN